MIYLPGGPSHMDMYDLKPDAPDGVPRRVQARSQTNVPGVQICEHFPLQARMWDKLAVIRSIVSVDEHSDSLVMTGYSENTNRIAHHPSFGSVVSRMRGNANADIPPFVSLRGMTHRHRARLPRRRPSRRSRPDGPGMRNLSLASGVDAGPHRRPPQPAGKLRHRPPRHRRHRHHARHGRLHDSAPSTWSPPAPSARALDLSNEDPRIRDRYRGIEQFLTARRLVEAGVGCVTLAYGGWDTHEQQLQHPPQPAARARSRHRQPGPGPARPRHGSTTSSSSSGASSAARRASTAARGRDHWAPVMSALVAGGGLRMGQAIGSSSARGEYPRDRRVTASQVLSTHLPRHGHRPGA